MNDEKNVLLAPADGAQEDGQLIIGRRGFLGAAAGLVAGVALGGTKLAVASSTETKIKPQGAVTQYYELRFAPPVHHTVMNTIATLAKRLKQRPGFLSLSFKQMVGLSTMVDNFPQSYKGILSAAYEESLAEHSLPYFYSLFVRFAGYSDLQKADLDDWMQKAIVPELYLYTSKGRKTEMPISYYGGVYQTVACGDREGVYTTSAEIYQFLRNQQDSPELSRITVNNHVSIQDKDLKPFEQKVMPLLKVAQDTFEPRTDPKGVGKSGSKTNMSYHRALTTEILRNAFPEGSQRNYMMHGVWESVWDHENSHIDPRFRKAVMPVATYVVNGPTEPFYKTQLLVNA